jgi:hypothetical protein
MSLFFLRYRYKQKNVVGAMNAAIVFQEVETRVRKLDNTERAPVIKAPIFSPHVPNFSLCKTYPVRF